MFTGPWKCLAASELSVMPKNGEIIRHRSGAIILRCPKCGKVQFTSAIVLEKDGVPTIVKRIQCGGGFCLRCGVWFSIDAGRTVLWEGPEQTPAVFLPEKLAKAGVFKR